MSRSPANRRRPLALAAFLAATAAAPAAAQQPPGDVAALHDRCIALAETHPKEGLDQAKLWREQGGGFAARHCMAIALYTLKDYRGAATEFEELAAAMMGMPKAQRAQTLDQAGQSWLAAGEASHAKADFDAALALEGDDADLLIDRAEAFAALKQYWEAIDDLNRAIELAPKRADAYVYRGSAYRSVDALGLALEDIEHGLALEPDSVLGLLERGNIRRLKGDVAGARQDWQRVVALSPHSPAGAAAEVNLDRLGAEAGVGAEASKGKKP